MDYSTLLEYQSFISDQLIEEAKLERFIKECLLIEESTNTPYNISILNESISDKIKNAITKVIQTIGKMWAKFVETVNTLVRNDKSYLEKYKDIILKKKPLDGDYIMYNYDKGIQNMLRVRVPVFNYDSMSNSLSDKETFIQSQSVFNNIPKGESSIADRCKAYFRGGSETITIKAGQLKMTDIFNYCYEYESKTKVTLEKDLKEIETAANKIADMINTIDRETSSQNESVINDKYYSHVYENYIHEMERHLNGEENSSNSTSRPDGSVARNMKNVDGDAPKEEDQKVAIKKDSSSYDDKIKKVQTYLDVCGGVLSAKLSISEEAYKEYMQIIKTHVRDHVGTAKKDKSNDKVADAPTNYKNIVDKAFGDK